MKVVELYTHCKARKGLVRKSLKRKGMKPQKPRKIKPKGISKLKKKLDTVFSKYIRAKYPKTCYTCGVSGKTLQCGHFVPRIYLATRWDESNCRPQCVGCNIWGRGQLLDFEENLTKELGASKVSSLKRKRNEIWKLDQAWYEYQIESFTQKLKELETVENPTNTP